MSSSALSEEAKGVLKKLATQDTYTPKKEKYIRAAEELVSKGLAKIKKKGMRCSYTVTEAGRRLAEEYGFIPKAAHAKTPVSAPPKPSHPVEASDLISHIESIESRLSSIEQSLEVLSREIRRGFDAIMRALSARRVPEARMLSAVKHAVKRFTGPTGWAPISDVLKSVGGELGIGSESLLDYLSELEEKGLCELSPGGVREYSVGGRLVGLIRWKGG